MRPREMHPLCCLSIDCGLGGADWLDLPVEADPDPDGNVPPADDVIVSGALYKWTNFGRGWRSRWFSLRKGVLTYYKIRPGQNPDPDPAEESPPRIIGSGRCPRATWPGSDKPIGFVDLKISAFRESKSDERRFYIFSPTKTLHLRTDSKEDRVAWIEALVSARSKFSLNDRLSLCQHDVSFSTKKLRDRMHAEGLDEALIKDCEQIVLSEFSDVHRQLKFRYEEQLNLLGTFQQQLEEANVEDENSRICDGPLQLMNNEFCSSGHGKYSEYSTTESSDDIEKQELDDSSDGEPDFYDSTDGFSECPVTEATSLVVTNNANGICRSENQSSDMKMINVETESIVHHMFQPVERRKKLPEPVEKEKGVSLWSIIKDNVGKDLTRVCLPVYFNEPLSSLQKCFEDLEYSYLLDRAYEYGKMGNSLMRILHVAAFAVSGYACCDGRPCKPFNPLLGETYEAEYPEKGLRFFSEKVSHHPMLIACHCEGKGWKFWGDSDLKSKFWGRSIQLDPVGVLTLEFDDGEIFQWSKVTTTLYNLILGKVYCDHHGTMNIKGNRQYSCKLKFKEQSFLDRNPRQVQGFVQDTKENKVACLVGKWDDSLYYIMGDDISKNKGCISKENASLLWKRSTPAENPTRYNLSSFAITLNELTAILKDKLPPTDSRLRPDQRSLENGEYEKANAEKLRLETRQRMSRKLQENGWKPRWFEKDSKTGTYRYIGGYWESREQGNWDDCPDIFGEITVDTKVSSCD